MRYTLQEVAQIVGGDLTGDGSAVIQHTVIDSREFYGQSQSLFIAIKGPNHDAHDYIKPVYNGGIMCYVISDKEKILPFKGANYIIVDNCLTALQDLARYHRQQFTGQLIGITGSAGKTIVKKWLYFLLKSHFNICRSPKSYNSRVGVPLSLLQILPEHNLALIEAGISKPGEMAVLKEMIRPDWGILTNIGNAHLHNFEDQAALEAEKRSLFDAVDVLIDHTQPTELSLEHIEQDTTKSKLQFSDNGVLHTIDTPFTDDASIENIYTAVLCCRQLGVPWQDLKRNIPQLPPIALRLEIVEGQHNCKIINDAYNSDINGLQIALSQLKKMSSGKKTVILSSLQLDNSNPEQAYKKVFDLVNQYKVDRLITVGEDIGSYMDWFGGRQSSIYPSTEALLNNLDISEFKDEWILVKGARVYAFERITALLEDKPHSTYLEVNLKHLGSNLNKFKGLLHPKTHIMAMVKAMSYGSGSHEIARYLEHHQIDYFGVAYTTEGIALRQSGISAPIMVMNSDPGNFAAMIEHNLEPAIFSLAQLDRFVRELLMQKRKQYPVHIELDTGMRRLGFEQADISRLCEMLLAQPEVRVASVFTHLAGADEHNLLDSTQQQIDYFEVWSEQIERILGRSFMRHVCNTAGIVNYPKAHYDMVRLGIGLHGIPTTDLPLKNTSSLVTKITQVKTVPSGSGVGYGYTDKVNDSTTIAIIPIGYADGFSRILSNGKGFVYHTKTGKLLPTIGRVCMDMTMINTLGEDIQEGDHIEIFGSHLPVTQLSEWMDTIPYEILSGISSRVRRKYLD